MVEWNGFLKYLDKSNRIIVDSTLLSYTDLFLKDGPIVDLGAGTGENAFFLKDRGFDVVCVDNCEESIKICDLKCLKVVNCDLEKFDLPKDTSGVVLSCVLHCFDKDVQHKILSSIKNKLKDDAWIFIKTFSQGNSPKNDLKK